MHAATGQWNRTGKPARVFTEFQYRTKKRKKGGWDRERRVVAKGEHIDGKENPRFVVTSLKAEEWAAQALHEEHGVGQGASGHDSYSAPEDRCPGASNCTEGLPGNGGELSVGGFVRAG